MRLAAVDLLPNHYKKLCKDLAKISIAMTMPA
jgi:hypothetical protein